MILYLISFSAFVTVIYLYCKNPVFHQTCYAFLVFYLIYEAYRSILNHPEIIPWAALSLGTYATGFLVWNIDNAFCQSLRHARSEVFHSAAAPMTQLHAWWHIFTGTGTYLHILVSAYARTLHLKRQCDIKMLGGVIPYLDVGKKV